MIDLGRVCHRAPAGFEVEGGAEAAPAALGVRDRIEQLRLKTFVTDRLDQHLDAPATGQTDFPRGGIDTPRWRRSLVSIAVICSASDWTSPSTQPPGHRAFEPSIDVDQHLASARSQRGTPDRQGRRQRHASPAPGLEGGDDGFVVLPDHKDRTEMPPENLAKRIRRNVAIDPDVCPE